MCKSIAILGLLAALLLPLGCEQARGKADPAPSATATAKAAKEKEEQIVIPIQAEAPKRGSISSYFETTARVEAENRVQVTAEAIGECLKVSAQEGDRVKAGDVLAELDQKTILATIGQTEVQVRQTKTVLDIAERSLAEGIGAKAERDNAQFAHEQALALLNMQKVQLSKLTVRAPISGVVTKKNVQEGQIVAMGVPVFTIVNPLSFMLIINPPEKELARLKVGQAAEVTVDALGDQEFETTVRRINPGVDSQTGTVKVTLDFDTETRTKLREAAFARVRLVLDTHENALLIPKDALVEENARKYVFVVARKEKETPESADALDKNVQATDEAKPKASEPAPAPAGPETPEPKPTDEPPAPPEAKPEPVLIASRIEVQTGFEDSNLVEILSGIEDNALIVTLGQHTLKSGSLVTVTNADEQIYSKLGLSVEDALKAAKEKRAGEDKTQRRRFVPDRHRH